MVKPRPKLSQPERKPLTTRQPAHSTRPGSPIIRKSPV